MANSITLRQLENQDRIHAYDLIQDNEAMRFLGPGRALTEQEAQDWFDDALISQSRFVIACSKTDELIGFVGIKEINGVNDFGYFIRRQFWGKGIAPEACQLALATLCEAGMTQSMEIFIANDNVASQAVAQKIGLKKTIEAFRHGGMGYLYTVPNI
ncbi:GNAT family N-acetyltransferase [Veronia nyctiphanis]|uniref:GNAT family N-acetyltransferase n=1 Tax=Veronia nyctiphanis TaxID=1278244 RepID=A0A4Q0YLY9_9GAMM|nr:GNAT family N-acetyltransferase [Veronia nyctiphanis]RXJ71810.1 GNAT family N-acetyltransferase [Veronia nyctiphanis]